MAIKSMLVPLSGYERDAEALVSVLALARRLGAHVDFLHVKADAREALPLVADGASASVIEQIIAAAEKETKARAAAATRLFKVAVGKAKVATTGARLGAGLATVTGQAADAVPRAARVHDLVVMIRLPGDKDIDWRLTLEAALMEGGRPLLLLPVEPAVFGKVVAIAWNGSLEAARAASAALPFLAKAKELVLLEGVRGRAIKPGLDAVAQWLARHGVKSKPRKVKLKGWPVGGGLAEEAAKAGADLLVMGAYGHSRMRETIFGGATRGILEASKLPVLLSH